MPPIFAPTLQLAAFFSRFDPAACPVIARSNQGQVVQVRTAGVELVVKMPSGSGLAWLARRYSLQREYEAYRRLAGVPGFPVCHGLFDRRYLVLEQVPATPLRHAELADRERFFARLGEIIEAMHARGVAHGDLKNKHNVLVDRDERPVVIDLGTAIVRKPGWSPLNRWLFDYLCQIDRNGWIKLKYGRYDNVGKADRHLLKRTLIERINSRLRNY